MQCGPTHISAADLKEKLMQDLKSSINKNDQLAVSFYDK